MQQTRVRRTDGRQVAETAEGPRSVRSLRPLVRRTPVLVATAALSARTVLAGCSGTAEDGDEPAGEDSATVG